MSHDRVGAILHHLRHLMGGKGSAARSDQELVEHFAATHEEEAFAELMRRHGAMVLAVAKRVLRDVHRAEDVFQAAFLVLARKAATIRRKEAVAGWLAQVAYRLALRARVAVARQKASDLTALNAEHGITMLADLDREELGHILDEELHGLPEKLHAPLVLCYLEGKTYEEAARQLNWPLGTFKDRVTQARVLLRKRLLRRGVAFGAGAAALAELAGEVRAAQVGSELLRNALHSALAFAAGRGVEAGAATMLAEAALRGMAFAKGKFIAGLLLALIAVGAGGALAYSRVAGTVPEAVQPPSGDMHAIPKGEAAVLDKDPARVANGLRLDLSAERTKTTLRPDGQGVEPVTFTLALLNASMESSRWQEERKTFFPQSLALVVTGANGKKVGMLSQTLSGPTQAAILQLHPGERLVITRFDLPASWCALKEPGRYSIRGTLVADKAPLLDTNDVVLTVQPAPASPRLRGPAANR